MTSTNRGEHMTRQHSRSARFVAALLAIATLGAVTAATASAERQSPAVDQPGVTDTEIKVGGIATMTNDPTGNTLGDAFAGVEAYFDYVNSKGGVHGRKLVLSSKRDDQLANNRQEVQGLLGEDDVFAALPIAVDLFTGADLLEAEGIPTFGIDIQEEWGSENNNPGPANFFGQFGSFICFTCAQPSTSVWLAKRLGLKKVAILSYTIEQSKAACEGYEKSFEKYPVADVVFTDSSLSFGQVDYSGDVSQMIDKGVDYVITCIDANGTVTLAREMKKQGLEAIQALPNAYNHELVEENAQFLEGSYSFTPFAPFETKPQPKGLKLYEKWIKKTDGGRNEHSLDGWLNAGLFVTGLKAAGPDFTRQKVVDAINGLTDYTADGLLPGVDWTKAHSTGPDCYAVMKITDGKFVPRFGKPGKPFVCLASDLETIPKNPEIR
jgi:ABC-type branched-subunit amino acid transport system substrate-binding protein